MLLIRSSTCITQEAEAGGSLEFEVNLVYRVSSRRARAAQGNPVSKTKKLCTKGC